MAAQPPPQLVDRVADTLVALMRDNPALQTPEGLAGLQHDLRLGVASALQDPAGLLGLLALADEQPDLLKCNPAGEAVMVLLMLADCIGLRQRVHCLEQQRDALMEQVAQLRAEHGEVKL